jgi:hypothetical protein
MAINYKLVTATSDASSPDTVFTATAVATHVKSIRIANESGGALTYHLAVYDNSATTEVPLTVPATSLPDDDVDLMVEPINLQNGDYIKLYSSGAGVKVALTLAENTDTAGATTSDDLAEGTTNLYLTSAERTKLTGIATGAEVNQNAFSNIAVSGQTTVAADAKTDTFTLVAGTGVTLTTDAGADSITIAASGSSSNSFETIAVAGQSSVVADSATDTLTLVAGTGITITTDAGADSVTITNSATGANAFGNVAVSGQTTVAADSTNDTLTLTAGTGITLTTDASTDTVTITNSVTAPNTFGTIAVAGQSNVVADSTTDTLTLTAGTGITLTTDASTDAITITNSVTAPNTFGTIAVSGQSSVVADSTTDTLTLAAGTNITITTDASTDTVTIAGPSIYSAVRTQSGTTYTLVLGDAGDYIQTTSSTAVTITVPPQADVTWAADTEIYFEQNNTGQLTIAAGSGVTINSSETLKTAARYAVVALKRVASDTWTLTGERELI